MEDWLLPSAKRLISVSDGEDIAVWDEGGDGEPVFFVHGFPENHLCWHGIFSNLETGARRFRRIVYDLRGHGESSKRGEASLARFFQDHIDIVKKLGLHDYHFVGHDWGGAVGLHVSRYRPDQLRSLIVLNTNYWKTDILGMWHLIFLNIPLAPALMFRYWPDVMVQLFLTKSFMPNTKFDTHIFNSYRAAFHDSPTTAYWRRLYQTMARDIVRPLLPGWVGKLLKTSNVRLPPSALDKFKTPTLLIWGDLDQFNPIEAGRAIEAGMKAAGAPIQFEIVGEAKHFVAEDQPQRVANLIGDFLVPVKCEGA